MSDIGKLLGPNWGKINGEDHPDTTVAVAATKAERARCLAICEGWIGAWQKENPKYVSAQKWATDAVQDIAEAIESGQPFPPTDTGSVT